MFNELPFSYDFIMSGKYDLKLIFRLNSKTVFHLNTTELLLA